MAVERKRVTVEEFERMPLDGSWELVDGELVEVSPVGGLSGKAQNRLATRVTVFVEANRLGDVFGSDTGVVLFPGSDLVRAPDLAFVRADRLPPAEEQVGFLRVIPDLVAEVRSPSDRMPPVMAKVTEYLEAGVPLVWLVDPGTRRVIVFTQEGPIAVLREADVLDGGDVLPGFAVPVSDLFA